MSYGSDVQGHNLTPSLSLAVEIAILWSHTNEQTGVPAFGYPAKDQRELAAECRRLMSMLVPDKHPLPELVPARTWLPARSRRQLLAETASIAREEGPMFDVDGPATLGMAYLRQDIFARR
jgi:hypothetical protein